MNGLCRGGEGAGGYVEVVKDVGSGVRASYEYKGNGDEGKTLPSKGKGNQSTTSPIKRKSEKGRSS